MISVAALASRFSGNNEFALVDPREAGVYSRGHILGSTNIPLSRLELDLPRLVPENQSEIILACDDGSLVDRTRVRLEQLGYANVHELEGGIDAWALAGYVLFSGVNVVSKAFGEFVEATLGTPHIDVQELKSWIEDGKEHFLLDGRSPGEHSEFCIPGAQHCANGDLPAIAEVLASRPDQPVVVHCAGRTRSIIGAQVLIDSAIPNPVYALKNGTLDWQYMGYELEHGAHRPFPQPDPESRTKSRKITASRALEYGIESVDEKAILAYRQGQGTTYVFDIRSRQEYLCGSLQETENVAGGQLVQCTDQHIAVRNSCIVLCDDDGIRATSAAIWLKRMGWKNLYVHTMDDPSIIPTVSNAAAIEIRKVTASELKAQMDAGSVTVLDIRSGIKYQRGHVPESHYISRHPAGYEARVPKGRPVVLVADDPDYCALVAAECAQYGHEIAVLEDGIRAWRKSGFSIDSNSHSFLCQPLDAHLDPGDIADPVIATREGRRYLNWEIELVDLLQGEPAALFST